MVYLATSINESPVISDKAGAPIEDVRGRAVKFNAEGHVVLCAAGDTALGVGIMTNAKGIAATVRRTLGSDINASCGQLRRNHLKKEDT